MKVFILLGIITFVCAEQQVDQLDCSIKGPQYWCKNEETAKECRAVSYCKEYVWEKENRKDRLMKVVEKPEYVKFTPEGSPTADICKTCQQVVGTIHMLILNNETQAMIISQLAATCNYLPYVERFICEEAVKLYAPNIINMILNYTQDPRPLCQIHHLCPQGKAVMKIDLKSPHHACHCCKETVGTIHTFLVTNNATIIAEIGKSCEFLPPSVQSMCKAYASIIFNNVVNYTKDPVALCTMLHLCCGNEKVTPQGKAVMKIDLKSPNHGCLFCKETVGTIHTFLVTNNATIIAEIGKSCEFLPPSVQSICFNMFKAYASIIFNDVVNYTKDPVALCTMLHLCSDNEKVTPRNLHFLKTNKADKVIGMKFKNNVSDNCDVCKSVVKSLYLSLNNKTTEQEVKATLLFLACPMFKRVYLKNKCIALITNYFDEFWNIVVSELSSPLQLCQVAGQCKTFRKVLYHNGKVCEYCIIAMVYMERYLGREIVTDCHEGCMMLPTEWQRGCKAFVSKYVRAAYDSWLKRMVTPKEVCASMDLCPPSQLRMRTGVPVVPVFQVNGGIECKLCQYAAQSLKSLLNSTQGQEEVKDVLLEICGKLPSIVGPAECKSLVNEYFDQVIKFLIEKLGNPEEFCKELGMCSSSMKPVDL